MSEKYNGHKNWTHWNVSLWIDNDERIYNLCKDLVRKYGIKAAAKRFVEMQGDNPRTPDGARYSIVAVVAAMQDM